jgi:hypothetical protein
MKWAKDNYKSQVVKVVQRYLKLCKGNQSVLGESVCKGNVYAEGKVYAKGNVYAKGTVYAKGKPVFCKSGQK